MKPKLEFTIMAIQKAMKRTKKTTSLHFRLCHMIPPPIVLSPSPSPSPLAPAGYLPMIAPSGPPPIGHPVEPVKSKEGKRKRDDSKKGGGADCVKASRGFLLLRCR